MTFLSVGTNWLKCRIASLSMLCCMRGVFAVDMQRICVVVAEAVVELA